MMMRAPLASSPGRGRRATAWQRRLFPYAMIAPNALIFLCFILIPAGIGIYYSLTDWAGLGAYRFIGLGNYRLALRDPQFWNSLWRTLHYALVAIPLLLSLPLACAILLTREIRGRALYRAALYWPSMISFIVAGIAFRFLFNDDSGLINYLLSRLGRAGLPWLTERSHALAVVVLATLWSRTGFYMVIFVAGLQNIPESYYEAARVDGASAARRFRSITLPLLRPTTFMVLMLGLIDLFKVYGLVIALTTGGPARGTTFIVQFIYETAFADNRLGYASALSVMLMIIVGILAVGQFVIGRGGEIRD